MDLYDDIPEVGSPSNPRANTSPVVSRNTKTEETNIVIPKIPESSPTMIKKETVEKETKTSVVSDGMPSLQFIPPALRAKALNLSNNTTTKKTPKKRTPIVTPSTYTARISNVQNLSSDPDSVRLEDVEDEYDPEIPNEYATYKKVLQENRKTERAKKREQEDMLAILQEVAKGNTEPSGGNQGNFGARLMRKYGWKAGQGIGKDLQGIATPLVAKTDGKTGVIINPDQNFIHSPSSIILLENMVDEKEDDLEEDVKEECTKYGNVLNVVIAKGFDQKWRVFVEFSSHREAKIALEKLNGRYFAKNQILARYYPKDVFKRREYTR